MFFIRSILAHSNLLPPFWRRIYYFGALTISPPLVLYPSLSHYLIEDVVNGGCTAEGGGGGGVSCTNCEHLERVTNLYVKHNMREGVLVGNAEINRGGLMRFLAIVIYICTGRPATQANEGVSNGLSEHLRAREQCVFFFCEHEQLSNFSWMAYKTLTIWT